MSLKKRVQLEFHLERTEKKGILITGFTIALVVFMFAWRTTDYSFLTGTVAFLALVAMSMISLFLFVSGAKVFGLYRGYSVHYNSWTNGLLVGFVVSFISYGLLPIIFPGHMEIKAIERLRHGKAYFGENKKDMFLILASAPLTALIVSFLFFYLVLFTGMGVFYYGVVINALIAFFSLLPFTKNIGATMFFARRTEYFALVGITAFYFIIIISQSIFPLLFILLAALIYWVVIAIKKKRSNLMQP